MLKKRYFLLIMLVCLLTISAVSAEEFDNDAIALSDDGDVSSVGEELIVEQKDVLNTCDDDVLSACVSDVCMDLDNNQTLVKVSAPNVTKYYMGVERFIVTITDDGDNPIVNAPVKITINGATYDRKTNDDGEASLALGLNKGIYKVTTEYNGTKYYSTVTIISTILSFDITKIYRNDTQYYATFMDSKGNYLPNGTVVTFNINGVLYKRNVFGNEGLARLNINLNPGAYFLTAENPANGEQQSSLIEVYPCIIGNQDLTKYYKNDSQYRIKLLDSGGYSVGAGVSAVFNINGVFYTRESDESGYVQLNINLNPGTYIITASYNEFMVSNIIIVKSILSSNDLNMKFRDGSKFEVKLLDGQGKAYANQNVMFNINGVLYTRSTDENGVARLNINLYWGEYIITAEYNGLRVGNIIRISMDPLYYTIGSNPLDYGYYMNEYNRFTFDWYYSPQWDAMVRTIYDIYGNQGMEIQDQYVHYGTKYVCWEEITGYSYSLNKAGELISVANMMDYYVEYKEYNYNNKEIIYHNIYLPNYDTKITTEIDGYDVTVYQWRTPSYSEVDVMVYDKQGVMVNLFDYDTMVFNNGKWYGPYDQSDNEGVATYHKWHMGPNSWTTEVAVKIRAYV